MKKRNYAVACFWAMGLSVCFSASASTTNKWVLTGTGSSITNAADYFDPGNWEGGSAATGTDAIADFSAVSGIRYIKLDRELEVYQLRGKDAAFNAATADRTVLVSDHLVTASRYDNAFSAVQLYAPSYTSYDVPYIDKTMFCGDMSSLDDGVWVNTGTLSFHLDLYANAEGEERSGFMPGGTLRFSWGDIRVYAPESSPADVGGTWAQKAGSPYLFPVNADHALSAGTLVSGAGIPEGTFLKRVFPDRSIELSSPVTETVEENNVVFAAFTPVVTHDISLLQRSGGGAGLLKLMKYREEDVMRFGIGSIMNHDLGTYTFDTEDGYCPGTFVMKPVTATKNKVAFGTCHIEFAPSSDGSRVPGIPNITVKQLDAASVTRLTVESGVSARIGGIDNLVGTVVKDGAGALAFGVTAEASVQKGVIVAKQGTLELLGSDDGEARGVGTLAVSNGAALKLPAGGIAAKAASFEKGAVVSGGLLIVPAGTDVSNADFTDGASVRFDGADDTVVLEAPEGEIVGNPAFHVDVQKTDSMVIEEEDGVEYVTRINDVRGAEYGFATNIVLRPWILKDAKDNTRFIYIKKNSDEADPATSPCLVWDKVITGIKAAFVVQECGWDGDQRVDGGQFLGKSSRIPEGGGDFLHAPGYKEVFWSTVLAHQGEFYINGERRDPDDGYLYQGYNGYNGHRYTPQVTDLQLPGNGGKADAFGCNNGANYRNGNHRLCECIIYTNALTRLEQLKIRAYLMKKWVKADVNIVQGPLGDGKIGRLDVSNGAGADVADGESVWVDAVSGEGELRKTGAGTLYVKELSSPLDAVKVTGGKMVLRSAVAPEDFGAENAFVHFDASRRDTLTLGEDGVSVKSWQSLSPLAVSASVLSGTTNFPTLATAEIGSLVRPVVDFGPLMKKTDEGSPSALKKATALDYSLKTQYMHTVIAVIGSRHGGGSLVGSMSSGYNDNWGLMRGGSFGASKDDPILRNDGWHAQFVKTDVTDIRTNGVKTVYSAGLSGGFDIVTVNSYLDFGARGLAGSHYNYYTGGQEIGEYLIWPRRLSDEKVEMAEAYLRLKWFGEETPGFRPAEVAALDVASGAELRILGGAVSVGKVSGSGKVTGSVAFTGDAGIEVAVASDGTVSPLEIDGDVDMSAGGTVTLVGALDKLADGEYPIVVSASLTAADIAGWNVAAPASFDRRLSLRVKDGALALKVASKGFIILAR